MKYSKTQFQALGTAMAAAILSACGGSQLPLAASTSIRTNSRTAAPIGSLLTRVPLRAIQSKSKALYKMSRPLLYVTNFSANSNNVTIYHADAKNPGPLAVISDGIDSPEGACIDGSGTLYVANVVGTGWVSEYPAGKTKPSKVIRNGIDTPAFCAIDDAGNLWVANFGGPNVSEYKEGTTKPHTVITKGLHNPVGIAIDHAGNLYVSDRLSVYSGDILVYSSGSTSPGRVITDGVTSPQGITVDANGTLYVTNSNESNVEEYLVGSNSPDKTITDGLDDPSDVTVNSEGYLFVNNYGNNVIVEYPPGAIKPSRKGVSKDLDRPEGSAYFPPLLP